MTRTDRLALLTEVDRNKERRRRRLLQKSKAKGKLQDRGRA